MDSEFDKDGVSNWGGEFDRQVHLLLSHLRTRNRCVMKSLIKPLPEVPPPTLFHPYPPNPLFQISPKLKPPTLLWQVVSHFKTTPKFNVWETQSHPREWNYPFSYIPYGSTSYQMHSIPSFSIKSRAPSLRPVRGPIRDRLSMRPSSRCIGCGCWYSKVVPKVGKVFAKSWQNFWRRESRASWAIDHSSSSWSSSSCSTTQLHPIQTTTETNYI